MSQLYAPLPATGGTVLVAAIRECHANSAEPISGPATGYHCCASGRESTTLALQVPTAFTVFAGQVPAQVESLAVSFPWHWQCQWAFRTTLSRRRSLLVVIVVEEFTGKHTQPEAWLVLVGLPAE